MFGKTYLLSIGIQWYVGLSKSKFADATGAWFDQSSREIVDNIILRTLGSISDLRLIHFSTGFPAGAVNKPHNER